MKTHTPPLRPLLSALLGLFAITVLSGCSVRHIPIPDGLAASERMPVRGRQGLSIGQRIRFGPYQTDRIDRSWTRGSGYERGAVSETRRRQSYRFQLTGTDGADAWRVRCEAGLLVGAIDLQFVTIEHTSRSGLVCALAPADGGAPWTLQLEESRGRPLAGTLQSGTEAIDVVGTDRVVGGLSPGMTTGYHLARGDEPFAAVEVLNAGMVWLRPGLTPAERNLAAAAAAALLAMQELRDGVGG